MWRVLSDMKFSQDIFKINASSTPDLFSILLLVAVLPFYAFYSYSSRKDFSWHILNKCHHTFESLGIYTGSKTDLIQTVFKKKKKQYLVVAPFGLIWNYLNSSGFFVLLILFIARKYYWKENDVQYFCWIFLKIQNTYNYMSMPTLWKA